MSVRDRLPPFSAPASTGQTSTRGPTSARSHSSLSPGIETSSSRSIRVCAISGRPALKRSPSGPTPLRACGRWPPSGGCRCLSSPTRMVPSDPISGSRTGRLRSSSLPETVRSSRDSNQARQRDRWKRRLGRLPSTEGGSLRAVDVWHAPAPWCLIDDRDAVWASWLSRPPLRGLGLMGRIRTRVVRQAHADDGRCAGRVVRR